MPIGFILTDNYDVKPVEYHPHPVMSKYVALPHGGRKLASRVYVTPALAIEAGRRKLKAAQRDIHVRQAKHDKRADNLDIVELAIK